MRLQHDPLPARGAHPNGVMVACVLDLLDHGWRVAERRRRGRSFCIAPLRRVCLARNAGAMVLAHERCHALQFGHGRWRGLWRTLGARRCRRVRLDMEVEALCHEAHAVWCIASGPDSLARAAARSWLASDLRGLTARCGRHCVGADPLEVQVRAFARLDEMMGREVEQ